MTRATLLAAGFVVFAVLATANSGGYRFGVSDQAFYLPAVALAGDPDLFPRDRAVLGVQTGLTAFDGALAAVSAATGLDVPALFLVVYAVTLLVLSAASVAFARALGLSWLATSAGLLLLTFRHRIAKTGANSLEGYMHPRQLAFALGVTAWVLVLKYRLGWAVAAIGTAAFVHPTTAVWCAVPVGVAVVMRFRAHPARLGALGAAAAIAGLWALTAGPLAGRLVTMDAAWLSVLADKDYLFAADWPVYAWVANLAYVAIVAAVYRLRRRAGLIESGERAIVLGLLLLFIGFTVSVPLTEAHLALAVQLQVNRIFWLLDFLVVAYAAWWLVDHALTSRRAAVAVVVVLALASAGRGVYLLTVEHAERSLVEAALPDTAWTDVMEWLQEQPSDWHVLADPGHAWKYGTSVRVAAERDTVLEAGKDTAIAMYDRGVALRVADRLAALSGFESFATERILELDRRYDLDVAVVERSRALALPELYRNPHFVVYDLR